MQPCTVWDNFKDFIGRVASDISPIKQNRVCYEPCEVDSAELVSVFPSLVCLGHQTLFGVKTRLSEPPVEFGRLVEAVKYPINFLKEFSGRFVSTLLHIG